MKRRIFRWAFIGVITVLVLRLLPGAGAAVKSWSGGGADGSWADANNWAELAAPAAGDNLVFWGSTGFQNTNDVAGFTHCGTLVFSNGNFVLRGNPLTFNSAAGITNRGGNNEVAMDLNYPSLSSSVPFDVVAGSSLRCSGNTTNPSANGNSGFFSKTGVGDWILSGAHHAWNAAGFIRRGAMILDSGIYNATNDVNGNLRIACNNSNTTARLVISNGASFSLLKDDGNFLIGRSGATNGTNMVEIYSGDLNLLGSSGRIVMGQDHCNHAVFNQYGGLVNLPGLGSNGGEVRLGYSGTNLIAIYNLNGGRLRTRTVVKSSVTNTGVFNFNGGILEPTTNHATFLNNLTAANVQDGGAVIDTKNFNVTIPLPLQSNGAGGLTKWGTGMLTLSASNTYAGPTLVNEGELRITGSLGDGTVTVAAGAVLSGTGSVDGDVTVATNGTLAPGEGATGKLTAGGTASLQGTSVMELIRSQPQNCDALAAPAISYGGKLWVTNKGTLLMAGDSFRLFEATTYSNTFASLDLPDLDTARTGLSWSNRLYLDGTLHVVGPTNQLIRSNVLARTKYNILFIAVDDLKPLVSCFGDPGGHPPNYPVPNTPNIDSIAAKGMLFTRAYCQMAVCSPSRTSLMTGLRPDTTGVWDLNTHFRTNIPNTITLGQHLGSSGYRTHGISKIYHGGYDDPITWTDGWSNPPAAKNFYEPDNAAREDAGDSKANAADCGDINPRNGQPVVDESYKDGVVATNALGRLKYYADKYHSNGTPFFLAVGFLRPHLPFNSPKKYWDRYNTNDIDVTGYNGTFRLPTNTLNFTAPGSGEPSGYTYIGDTPAVSNTVPQLASQAHRLIHGYLASVSYTDANIGKLLRGLETNGVASNTVVVLWGDHGWHLADHGAFWAKHSNFEQATHSLLVVSVPGMDSIGTAGKKCPAPVEFVDIYPSLVDLAGLSPPAQPAGLELQGTSFVPLLEDPNQAWKKGAISQYTRNINGAGIAYPGNGMGYSLRTMRYRYTEWWRTGTGVNRHVKLYSNPEYAELYDYEADPAESINQVTNLAYSNVVSELKAMLAGGLGWGNSSIRPPYVYPTNWSHWQSAHTQPGYPVNVFEEQNDPDYDGRNNLAEYALGSHPLTPDGKPTEVGCQAEPGTNWVSLQYPRVVLRSDAWIGGAQSGNLQTWDTNGVAHAPMTSGYPAETWRSRIPLTANTQQFLRLQVER